MKIKTELKVEEKRQSIELTKVYKSITKFVKNKKRRKIETEINKI